MGQSDSSLAASHLQPSGLCADGSSYVSTLLGDTTLFSRFADTAWQSCRPGVHGQVPRGAVTALGERVLRHLSAGSAGRNEEAVALALLDAISGRASHVGATEFSMYFRSLLLELNGRRLADIGMRACSGTPPPDAEVQDFTEPAPSGPGSHNSVPFASREHAAPVTSLPQESIDESPPQTPRGPRQIGPHPHPAAPAAAAGLAPGCAPRSLVEATGQPEPTPAPPSIMPIQEAPLVPVQSVPPQIAPAQRANVAPGRTRSPAVVSPRGGRAPRLGGARGGDVAVPRERTRPVPSGKVEHTSLQQQAGPSAASVPDGWLWTAAALQPVAIQAPWLNEAIQDARSGQAAVIPQQRLYNSHQLVGCNSAESWQTEHRMSSNTSYAHVPGHHGPSSLRFDESKTEKPQHGICSRLAQEGLQMTGSGEREGEKRALRCRSADSALGRQDSLVHGPLAGPVPESGRGTILGSLEALEEHYAAALERCQAERRTAEEQLEKERELLAKEKRERAEERAALLQTFERQLAAQSITPGTNSACARCQELHAELQLERKTRAEERSTLMRAIKGQSALSQTEERLSRLRQGDVSQKKITQENVQSQTEERLSRLREGEASQDSATRHCEGDVSQESVTRRRRRHRGSEHPRSTGRHATETPQDCEVQKDEAEQKPEEEQVHCSVMHFLHKLAEARRFNSSEDSLSAEPRAEREADADGSNLLSACGGG